MTSSLWKNIRRDISKTKARFISIMLIVALGVGFFTGVKATSPSMNATAEQYYSENNLMDISLLSTVGFSDKDADEILKLPHVRGVMPSYFTDAIMADDGTGSVVRLYSAPKAYKDCEPVNTPVVKSGRLPEKTGEIALENANFNNSKYKIGDTVNIEPEVNGKKTSDTLESLSFTVVGFVQSPLYVSFDRGSTNVGNGSIHMFGIVAYDEFVCDRYTQMYVTTDYSDGSVDTLSDEFNSLIADLEPQFIELGKERAGDFDEEYLIDAKKKLADVQSDLDDERERAEKELADAEKKLTDAEQEYNDKIADAEKKLDDAKQQIDAGEKALEQGRKDYENGITNGSAAIDSGNAQLKDAQQQLLDGKSEYNQAVREAEKQLNQGEREYSSGLDTYNDALSQYNTMTIPGKVGIAALQGEYELKLNKFENITKPTCDAVINEAQKRIDSRNEENDSLRAQLEASLSSSEALILQSRIAVNENLIKTDEDIISREQRKIEEGQAEVDSALEAVQTAQAEFDAQTAEPKAQLDTAKEELDSARQQLDEGQSALAQQKLDAESQFAAAQQQITEGQSSLTQGQSSLAEQKTEGLQKLNDSEAELKEAKKSYEEGKKELEKQKSEGKAKLDEAREEYEKGKTEAEQSLNDAQAQIDSAKEQLNSLENPEWYFMTRLDNPGYKSLIDDTTRVDAVATVFPLFFLLVAALVCLTTLTRQVDEKRTEIGTLKALGYSNGAIKAQFVIYSSAAAFVGCVLGISIGIFTFPYIIYNAYGIMYELLPLKLVVPINIAAVAVLTAFVCTALAALFTCHRALREKPSALMRPKAPKVGKKIMLERIPFIWGHMNFTSKVTARNLMRYKLRFFMTVIGVAGCTALILTGFGLKDSINSIADKQFGEIFDYDMIAVLNEENTAHKHEETLSFIRDCELVDSAMLERQLSVEAESKSGVHLSEDVYLFVPQSVEDMNELVHLRERVSGKPIELTDNGVVITEKMADILSVKAGDTLTVIDDHRKYDVKVTGVAENYISGYVFISPTYYEEIYGKAPLYNLVMCRMTDNDSKNESKLGTICLDNDSIAAVSFISGALDTFRDTISSLDIVTLVLIISAGLLAVVVLYNLTNINIAERVREIATIKVLGFYNNETSMFVYRENIILTLCGSALGAGLGVILHRFVIMTIEVNKTMFGRELQPMSFVYAIGLTILFAAAVNFVMYFKIKKIDMVESLKSIE